MPRYLADTSIWAWAAKPQRPDITKKLVKRVAADEVLTCVPVALEVMHRPDTGAKYQQQFETLLEPLEWLTLTESAGSRAMEIQRQLAAESVGGHRRPPTDFLIAAIAEENDGVVLWAFDNDYAVIAAVTGRPRAVNRAGTLTSDARRAVTPRDQPLRFCPACVNVAHT